YHFEVGFAIASWIRLQPRQQRQYDTTERSNNLGYWEQQQPVRPIVIPELFAAIELADQQIIGVSCEVVHNIESRYPRAILYDVPKLSLEGRPTGPEAAYNPNGYQRGKK